MAKKAAEPEYTDEQIAQRAEDAIRRSFAMPHTPRKAIVTKTPAASAQAQRRAKGSPKSK